MTERYDIIVIGSGPGGYVAALKAGQMGAKTAIVEAAPNVGGTCLNFGCIPSKALLATAELLHTIEQAGGYGVTVPAGVSFDWPAIQKRKDKVLATLRGGIEGLFKARKVTLIHGRGKLAGAGKVLVEGAQGKTELTAAKIILAVGSVPSRVPGWPTDPNVVCTSDEALHWSSLPKRLLIVGGGVIGCEFACMMRQFGVEVTVVEMLPRLLPPMDESLGEELAKTFKKRSIACHVNTKVDELKAAGAGAIAKLSNGQTVEVDKVLVATGRRPNTADIGLETVGITADRGFIRVNDRMETSAAGVYCIGDANGRCLLAHAASAHGVTAVENALGHDRPLTAAIPWCVYTFPEIAGVGLSAAGAMEAGLPVSIGTYPIGHLGKAMAVGHTEGFVKVVRNRETDEILGVHMLGHNATECIAAAGALIGAKASVTDFAETVFAHPTIGESMKEAAEDALGVALHLPPRKVARIVAG
ncbi:MAG: dihydrolipoyl dehydrogenase [Planctomycetota bacterium]|nr:dihydrolipoyl dehydrogenase [Planctomycetota bacterium]